MKVTLRLLGVLTELGRHPPEQLILEALVTFSRGGTKLPQTEYKGLSNMNSRASLVAQWLRIHLLMQGTRVRALGREDSTFKKKKKKMNSRFKY